MKNLALKRVRNMSAYKPPSFRRQDYSGLLLDLNERSVPSPPEVTAAVERFATGGRIQVYPEYPALERKLAEYAEVEPAQVMITNGSDRAIEIVFRTFTDRGHKVVIPQPSFSMLFKNALLLGNDITSPSYSGERLDYPLREVLTQTDGGVKMVVVCSPNNPTGTALELDAVREIASKSEDTLVLVDEAYYEYSSVTAVPLIRDHPNVIVTRTLSKAFGLASLRIGYAVANELYVAEMLKVRGPYDVNMAAYYAACAAVEDRKPMEGYVREVMQRAKPMVEQFFTDNGIRWFPSSANFILFEPDRPELVLKHMLEGGILIRHQSERGLERMLRVSIGTPSQMERFIAIYREKCLA